MAKNKKVRKFSKFANNQMDFILLITVILLLSLGLIMVLSASSPTSLSETGDDSYVYFKKQATFAVIGVAAMLFISKIDYRFWKKFYKIAYIASIILLLMVLIPGIGRSAGGARRWINLGIQFQPSELAKIGLIIFYASYLTDHKDELKDFKKGFVKPLLYLIPVVLILILVLVVGIMMLMAGVRPKYFATVGTGVAVAGAAGLYAMAKFTSKGAFRIARITSFLNPWADKQGDGWQVIQSLYAIGSGGLFGVGLGQSKQKYLYISEPHTDFIFAVLAEELGFVGCAIVIGLFGIFIWRGVLAAMKAPDMFGSLVAVGITSLIGLQAIINIAVVTSSMPVTGMPLPFFSYGVTSLLILLCSVGVLLNISRAGTKV